MFSRKRPAPIGYKCRRDSLSWFLTTSEDRTNLETQTPSHDLKPRNPICLTQNAPTTLNITYTLVFHTYPKVSDYNGSDAPVDWLGEHGPGSCSILTTLIGHGQLTWLQGMAKNVVEKADLAHPVLLYNRTKERSVEFSSQFPTGTTEIVDSIAAGVAKADIIFTILAKDDVVEAVADEILKAVDVKGKLFVECSTIHPDTTVRVAKAFHDRGAEFVAAPVFGAPAMAEVGQLVGVLAGPGPSVQKARQFFKGVMAKAEIDMSDQPYEKALQLKLIGNTFILNMVEQLSEGLVLAEKSGLGTQYVHQFVENILPGPYAAYSTRILSGAYHRMSYPLFPVDLAKKDARHALDLAEACGARMRNLEVANAHLDQVKEHDGTKGDIAGIYGAVRKESGLKYENN